MPIAEFIRSLRETEPDATFREGGFASGTADRSEFSARIFHEATLVTDAISREEVSPALTLEVGCGYGRLSPWIARESSIYVGIDPDREALRKARTQYPNLDYRAGRAQEIPIGDTVFDLTVTWTVLQHIPPEEIESAINEVERVTADDGHILICEETEGETLPTTWPRPVRDYETMFDNYSLVTQTERAIEPTYPEHCGRLMLFKGENAE